MARDLSLLVKHFRFKGRFLEASPYGFGHINDTYVVSLREANGGVRRYVLQRINQNVFKDPGRVMENIEAVTAHLRVKIASAGGDPDRETLTLIPTVDGGLFYRTEGGDYWRAYLFIEGAITFQVVENLEHVYHAARAFGRFQRLLSDFAAERLHETVPDFHHTGKRFEALVEAVESDRWNRAQSVQAEVEFAVRRAEGVSVLVDLSESGALPVRVTHNDTKFNNVMIDDETGEGICVIDLDTVMPGLSLYDFGDAVRSGANPAAEDERDLTKVRVSLEILDCLTHGYLDATRDFLTTEEIDLMPFSARLMAFECGIRFLTDHLNGDVYFKVQRENQNLDRCRAQFKMVRDMEAKFEQMVNIVGRYR